MCEHGGTRDGDKLIDFRYILEVESKHLVIADWIWEMKWDIRGPTTWFWQEQINHGTNF